MHPIGQPGRLERPSAMGIGGYCVGNGAVINREVNHRIGKAGPGQRVVRSNLVARRRPGIDRQVLGHRDLDGDAAVKGTTKPVGANTIVGLDRKRRYCCGAVLNKADMTRVQIGCRKGRGIDPGFPVCRGLEVAMGNACYREHKARGGRINNADICRAKHHSGPLRRKNCRVSNYRSAADAIDCQC